MAYDIQRVYDRDDMDDFFHNAVAYAASALNLDDAGNPLTYAKAMKGSHAGEWWAATATEYRKLFQTKTIKPIHRWQQPSDRIKDTTYLNLVVAEKMTTDGKIKRRVRGTAGRDIINYPHAVQKLLTWKW